MWTAVFDSAQTSAVPLTDASPVFEVNAQVIVLGAAPISIAHRLMACGIVRVDFAEVSSAVLTGVRGGVVAAGKPPAYLAFGCCHMIRPVS
jgi:hypothetical protein